MHTCDCIPVLYHDQRYSGYWALCAAVSRAMEARVYDIQ